MTNKKTMSNKKNSGKGPVKKNVYC